MAHQSWGFAAVHSQVMQASFGRPISALFGRQFALSVAAPADACAALSNSADVAGTVVLVLRGTCTFAVKVLICCSAIA